MTTATLFGLCGALLIGLGLYGSLTHPEPLRKLIGFNLLGSGIFLMFGAIARRGAWSSVGGDPVPQALVITAIVVAFAATALVAGLLLRLFEETGAVSLSPPRPSGQAADLRPDREAGP